MHLGVLLLPQILTGTMNRIYPIFLLLFTGLIASAQPSVSDIPLARQYFHDKIDASQKNLLKADYKDDSVFAPTDREDINQNLTWYATTYIDSLQTIIERETTTNSNGKIKFLKGLNDCLLKYVAGYHAKTFKPVLLADLMTAFSEAMQPELNNLSIGQVVERYPYEVGNILIHSAAYSQNSDIKNVEAVLVKKYCTEHPEKIMSMLSQNPNSLNADSLILLAARRDPDGLYSYASAFDELSTRIHNNPDSLVKIIAHLSRMKAGRQYFPFLDNIYNGSITLEQIDAALRDSTLYYKLLVKTEIDYAGRTVKKDTPVSMQALTNKLAFKAKEIYINTINGLHEAPDNVRFRSLDNLSPQELYYLAVLCEEEIYTSSYVRGVYAKVWKGAKPIRGDSLLMAVNFDHYKKWIKMAANYNTLDDYLKRMDKLNAELLMKAFVNGLDKTNSLEDAVDVANSFAGISDKKLRTLITTEVQGNLKQAQQNNNVKAANIYNILNTLFLSIDSSNHIDVSKVLNIPPVFFMPNKLMRDTSGRIIIQQFFYGDRDGKGVFNSFLGSFSNANWKRTDAAEWVVVSSTKGTPISIYCNRPLDEEKNLDAEAQRALGDYLYENDLNPTMVIHRGHSYYLSSTLDQLVPSAKIILLGSCGAYQSLDKVLKTCPTAQIISSKQTGSGHINAPLISTIAETLRQGKDLNWPNLWTSLQSRIGNRELFDDYVPPHRNLGAVFIMAYQKISEQ